MRKIIRVALPILVLAAGIGAFKYMKSKKPSAGKVERKNYGTLVEVIEAKSGRQLVSFEAQGTVVPAQQILLAAEVGGRVQWMNDKLIPGGRFAKGEQLVRIDSRDYKLAMQQQFAQVDRASTELELEKSRKAIAEREWQILGQGKDAGGGLALREPQLRTAEVALEAARSGLERAKLSVGKTNLAAPFNALVQTKNVDIGQLVGPAAPIAALVGTDAFWVQVSIPVERLTWIQVPGLGGATEGSAAKVSQRVGGELIVREGRVVRLLGDLDPAGRMARVLVEIIDPLGLNQAADAANPPKLPLLLGSYVTVEIAGRELDNIVELPREALRDGDSIYVMTADNTLEYRDVEVIWRRPKSVLTTGGLADGTKVVVSPVPAPVEHMLLRTVDMPNGGAAPPAAPQSPPAKPADSATPASGALPNGDQPPLPADGAERTSGTNTQGAVQPVAKPSR